MHNLENFGGLYLAIERQFAKFAKVWHHQSTYVIIGQVPVYSNLAEGEAVFTAIIDNIDFTWIFLEVRYQSYSDV